MTNNAFVEVKNLKKHFHLNKKSTLKAVDDVSFFIRKGETFGLVGESGCGKTTCGKTILGLYSATAGEVIIDGVDMSKLSPKEKRLASRKAQLIFQDPYASLNPRMTVGDIIAEGMDIHGLYKGKERMARIYDMLDKVGLNSEHATRFPHEFSGGQRQRIGIARALALNPEFIVCDEPISALDVSVQAQVVNLLIDLQNNLGLTYLFIAHDLSMVRHISDRIGVMYLGTMVEMAGSNELYEHPLHPYTQALLSAIPIADPSLREARKVIPIDGEVPSPINPKPGCRFAPRCKFAKEICKVEVPQLREMNSGHFVACHVI